MTRLARDLVWACLVVAVATYGAVVVRNVTDTLVGITSHQPSMVVAQRPSR
jgi:F0F1-type ATP synthase membrane subunit c/vacuolar-type H+-ATPase subunit K